jgi:hypothetical protein
MLRRRATAALAAMLFAAACSSSAPELPLTRPLLEWGHVPIRGTLLERQGPITVGYVLQVKNRADVPIRLRRIEMRTMTGTPYQIQGGPIDINQEIGAMQDQTITFSAWALSAGRPESSLEPVSIRGVATFDSERGPFSLPFNILLPRVGY